MTLHSSFNSFDKSFSLFTHSLYCDGSFIRIGYMSYIFMEQRKKEMAVWIQDTIGGSTSNEYLILRDNNDVKIL